MQNFRAQRLPSELRHATNERATNGQRVTRQNVLIRLDKVAPRAVEWIWPGRIVLGRLTLVIGEPCSGKSFLTLDLAARVSRGGPWPGGDEALGRPGAVVLWSGHDDLAETVRPRLDSLGADITRIVAVQSAALADDGLPPERPLGLVPGLDAADVDSALGCTPDCKLAVIDPLVLHVEPGRGLDESSSRLLASLAQMAARRQVAVVAVVEVAGKSYGAALEHAARCLAAEPAVDALWQVVRARDEGLDSCESSDEGLNSCESSYEGLNSCESSYKPSRVRRRCIAIKHRVGPELPGLAFEIRTGRVIWSEADHDAGPVPRTSEAKGDGKDERKGPKRAREFAADWLVKALGEGPIESTVLFSRAAGVQIARGTLRRAAAELGLTPRKQSWCGCWVWHLEGRERRTESTPSRSPSQPNGMNSIDNNDGVNSALRVEDAQDAQAKRGGGADLVSGEW